MEKLVPQMLHKIKMKLVEELILIWKTRHCPSYPKPILAVLHQCNKGQIQSLSCQSNASAALPSNTSSIHGNIDTACHPQSSALMAAHHCHDIGATLV